MAWLEQEQLRKSLESPTLMQMKRLLGISAFLALIIIGHSCGIRPSSWLVGDAYAAPAKLDQIAATGKASARPAKKLWVCPMHPEVIQDRPGICPKCGMDLVEMERPDASQPEHNHGIQLNTASQQKLGVRLAAAKLQTLSQDIHAYGIVAADESLIFNLNAKVEGVIKKLHVNSVGQQIRAGQVLYEIYSAELVQLQEEFIGLLKKKDKLLEPMEDGDAHIKGKTYMPDDDMMEVAMNARSRILIRDKLLYADTGNELIEEITRTYRSRDVIEVRAPQSGFVTKIEVHEGSSVKPMDNLFSFANLSRVWVEVPLYPDQLAWVKVGNEVTVKSPQSRMPGIKARLQVITPVVDGATRTVNARLSVNNTKNLLLAGAFLDVIIHANPHRALVVPRSAVMRSGKGDTVMLSNGSGHFTPVKVETGIEAADSIEITAGLQAGDQVAVNGQFLLDAAASMSDAAQRMRNNHDEH